MMKTKYFAASLIAIAGMLTACQDSYENVADNNKIWNESLDPVALTLLNGKSDVVTKEMSVTIAQPEASDVYVTYAVADDKLAEYKAIYGGDPVLLPAANYEFTDNTAVIKAGAVKSSAASITFEDLLALDDTQICVLHVSMVRSGVEAVKGRSTRYYEFRGAALINTVGNMTGTCMRFVNEGQTPMLANMRQMTFEVLVRPDAFTNTLSTLIGIEGSWLIRVGDAGIPSNQIQVAASPNATDPAWQLETGKWTFITLTYDADNGGAIDVYFNGVKKGSTQKTNRSPNWNVVSTDRACYIGYAYDTDRDFQGDMCEMRIWNRVLTPADLAQRNHFYRVDPDSDGLVAYWKFDEGAGNLVHDYANGYDMYVPATFPGKASKPGDIKWNSVTLP